MKFPLSAPLFFLSLSFLLLTSCARPVPPPAAIPPDMDQVLQQKLQALDGAFESLRGLAKVRVRAGDESMGGNQVLLARRPDLLRVEALSPFGNPVLVAATAAGQLSVLAPGEGKFLQGPATFQNLVRFTRLPLRLEDLVEFLLYDVPVIPFENARVEAAEKGQFRLILQGIEEIRQEFLFDPQLRLVDAAFYQGRDLVLRAGYGRFSEDEAAFPRTMIFQVPEQAEVSLVFSDLDVNVSIPRERFTLEPPPGYEVEELP